MLQLLDLNKNKIAGLTEYKDLCIESVLETGDKTLSFLYSKKSKYYYQIIEESYIRTKTDEYVVKEKDLQSDYTTFICKLNVEDIEGKEWDRFESIEQTIINVLNLAIVGTGWTIGKTECDIKKKRTVRATNCSSWDIIQQIKKTYRVEIEFDTISKKINLYEHLGADKGTYFIDSLNLKALNVQGNSYEYVTRIIPIGKDGMTIEDINDGKKYLENYQYTNKVKTLIWKDERYTIKENLLEDAKAKLNEISKPYRAYSVEIINLAKLNDKYKNILEYNLGDTITILSKENKIKEKQRIVKLKEYPQDHTRDTVELANIILRFEDIHQQFEETSDTVDNITTDNGTVDGSTIDSVQVKQIEDFKANVIEVVNLKAINASIDNLKVIKADIQDLHAVTARIGTLESTTIKTTDLEAVNAKINNLQSNKADINLLNAQGAKINTLEAKTASIDNLLAGNLTANNFKANSIVAGSAIIAENAIGSSQISSLSVNKLEAGDISTSKFRIISANGSIQIVGNQLLVNRDNINRVVLGEYIKQDNTTDYGLLIRAKDGKTIMLDGEGVHNAGITDGAINNNKVADNANISGNKLDINSVIREVNNKGTETIKGTKVQVGDRTLDIELSTQNNTITEHSKELSNQKATIQALDNAIKLKVDNQTFTQSTDTIKGNINSLNSDLVNKIDTSLNNAKADATNKANNALNSAKEFTTAQITTTNSNLSKATSEINILKEQINTKVGQVDVENSIIKAKTENYGYAYKKDIIIYGDYNLYYPVVIKGGNQNVKRKIFINRSYAEQAPSEWNPDLATHHGGLELLISVNFGGWGGANYSWNIVDLEEQYSRMFAGATNCASNMAFAIFLRGGGEKGAVYHLYSDQPLDSSIGWEKEDVPKPTSPQIAYNGEMISFYKPAYEFYAPKPRTITKEVEEEIKKRKFIQLTQDNATEITIANNKINDVSTKLTQTKDSLQASVNSLNSTTQTITTNITNTTNDLSNKITLAKNDAINSSNYYTNTAKQQAIDTANSHANNIAETKKNEAIIDARKIPDTRNDNQNPDWYIKNYARQTITEFKLANIIKIPNGGSVYGTLETKVPWGDSSGGYPTQIFRSNSYPTYQRHGISNTAWSSWEQIEDTQGSQAKANNALSSANAYTTAQITTVNTRVSNAESSINILKNQISTKVSQSDIDKTVNNIQIGGRNLLRDTKNISSSFWKRTETIDRNINYGGCAIQVQTNDWWYASQYYQYIPNKTYTFSCMCRADKLGANIYASPHISHICGKSMEVPLEWTKFSYTFTTNNKQFANNGAIEQGARFECSNLNGKGNKVYITQIKLEEGNKPTDWTPAPEDIGQEIKDNITTVTTKISNVESNLKQAKDSLQASVEAVSVKTNSVSNSLNETKNDLLNRVNSAIDTSKKYADEVAVAKANLAQANAIANADGKITAEEQKRIQQAKDNLNTAIAKADATKAEAVNLSKRYANTQLNNAKDYTNSAVASVKSQITVDLNGIKTEVSKKTDKDNIISSINQSAEEIKIDASKINIDGATTLGDENNKHIFINKGNYSVISENNVENAYLGYVSWSSDNVKDAPRLGLAPNGFNSNSNYFVMTAFRSGQNPQDVGDYLDMAYRVDRYNDYSNIKMYDNGDIRIAALRDLEITTNSVSNKYQDGNERRLAIFSTSSASAFNSYLAVGCIRNFDNGNGLILADDKPNRAGIRIQVSTDSSNDKYFRPMSDGDILLGSTSFRWYRGYFKYAPSVSSHRHLKTNIVKFDDLQAYTNIKNMNIYTFNLKKFDDNGNVIGYDNELCLGTMIDELPIECCDTDNTNIVKTGVDMYGYTSYAISALKVAIDKIEKLEKEIEKLKKAG